MFSPFRRLRPLPLLVAAAAAVSFGACNGNDSPLAPAEDSPAAPALAAPADDGQVGAVTPDVAALTTTQRIAFISPRDGQLNLYKMDPSGSQVARLTNTTAQDQEPAWSYDNKRIAVVRYRMDGSVGHDDIWVVNADGTNGHWVSNTLSPWDLLDPSWAPDGSHLLMVLWVQPNWYLAKMDVATGTITLIHPYGGGIIGRRPTYDKAGQRILYVGASRLTVDQVNPDGSGHKVRYTSASLPVDYPSFSPDGKRIAFSKGFYPGNTDVYVRNLGTGVVTRLTSTTASDGFPTWSPDGTKLAFVSTRSGKAQIYTMNSSTGGSLTRITFTSVWEASPAWSH
jgi:Tol biopolymer transport system component